MRAIFVFKFNAIFMMDQLIKKFPAQLKEAIEIGENVVIHLHTKPIHKVIMVGMGGSGIGGAYVSDLISDECFVPYIILSSYKLPAYTDENTLLIVSSYSGNTEETIAAMEQAIQAKAKIVCISSGGIIMEYASSNGLDHIKLPTGWPSPRACLGYSIIGQLFVLNKMGLISHNTIDQCKMSADLLSFEQEDIMQKAEKLAGLLVKKTPVIYTTDRNESVAIRWRQQINENSKVLCWHHVIPEMNHNELVGWKSKNEDLAVIFLRNRDDLKRNQIRIDISKQIISQLAPTVIEIYSKGQSLTEKMMYLTHLGDWLSWYLAQLNNVDASEIQVIDFLKSELEKSSI